MEWDGYLRLGWDIEHLFLYFLSAFYLWWFWWEENETGENQCNLKGCGCQLANAMVVASKPVLALILDTSSKYLIYMNQFSFCLVAPPGLCVQGWFIDPNDLWNRFIDVFLMICQTAPTSKVCNPVKSHKVKINSKSTTTAVRQCEFSLIQTFPSQLLSAVSWLKPVVNPPLWNGKQCRPVHAPGLSTWFCVVSPDFKTPTAKLISDPIDSWRWIIGPMTMIWISEEPRIR